MARRVQKSEAEWRQELTDLQHRVTREGGTERPFTGAYVDHDAPGIYRCVGCDEPLFASDTKYHSGSGWPSFWDVIDRATVELRPDHSHGMSRVEVVCASCGAHLGHLFPDGPEPTGQRYCINSAALRFESGE